MADLDKILLIPRHRPADKIVFTDYWELASRIGSSQHDDDDSVQDKKKVNRQTISHDNFWNRPKN